MHILLIHQAFVTISEPGGTRHHELARELVKKGHTITIIASPVSYLTGKTSDGISNRKTKKNRSPGFLSFECTHTLRFIKLHPPQGF